MELDYFEDSQRMRSVKINRLLYNYLKKPTVMHFHQYDHYISFDIGEHGELLRHFVHIRGDNKAQKHQRDSRSRVFASFKQQVAISFMLISMQND